MARTRSLFICASCGNENARWLGQCPACGEWNTLAEERRAPSSKRGSTGVLLPLAGARAVTLAEVHSDGPARWSSGIDDLDFVLGGGIVPASVVLVGGEPGIGKSTLLLQLAGRLVGDGHSVLYLAGEESTAQVRLRAERLSEDTNEVRVLPQTELGEILQEAERLRPDVMLVDSIQTVYSLDVEGVPGSIGQVRECAARLHRYAKEYGTTVILVGHVTKAGGIAGPKTLEHIVDTVLYFEESGGTDYRLLRATKNRFGSVDEITVFRMTGAGLVVVPNPSELFLGEREIARVGCAIAATIEGSRPVLVEIQALATRASFGAPQRVASGFDHKRLALLLAVLEKRAGIPFGQLDVFLNVVGGYRVREPAADAAAVLALASSAMDLPVPADTVALGEVGLTGELRSVDRIDRRLAEAAKMGFKIGLAPRSATVATSAVGLRVRQTRDVGSLVAVLRG